MPFAALVVLGCRVGPGSLPPPALRRVEQAARTYHELGAELVVASGGKRWGGTLEAVELSRALAARGVPSSRVLEERRSLTTRGNAREVTRLLRARGVERDVAIVTCDWHLPRALALFRRAGLHATGVPALAPSRGALAPLLVRAREGSSLAVDLLLTSLWFDT